MVYYRLDPLGCSFFGDDVRDIEVLAALLLLHLHHEIELRSRSDRGEGAEPVDELCLVAADLMMPATEFLPQLGDRDPVKGLLIDVALLLVAIVVNVVDYIGTEL